MQEALLLFCLVAGILFALVVMVASLPLPEVRPARVRRARVPERRRIS